MDMNDNNLEASSSESETEKASVLANVEESELQGSKRSSLGVEAKNEVIASSSPSLEADLRKFGLDEISSSSNSSPESERIPFSGSVDNVKGRAARHIAELTEEPEGLPLVPTIDVALSGNHQTFPVGVVHSILGKEVIVEGTQQHAALDEGSILWVTESRVPLGLVDEIYENPYYVIRYNNENEVPSDVSVGTPVSFVPEFAKHVRNDDSVDNKEYDASERNDEELHEGAVFSDDDEGADYRQTLNINASHYLPHPPAIETPCNHRYQFSERGQDVPSSAGMAGPFQHISHPTSFDIGSDGVWPNGMPILPQEQAMFFPNAFPTNAMPWMQQNSLVHAGCPGMAAAFQNTTHLTSFDTGSAGVWPNGMGTLLQQQPRFLPYAFPTNGMPWMQQQRSPVHAGAAVIQHISHPTSFHVGSDGVWPNGMEIQEWQPPMFFPYTFPTNGMSWMQQNRFVPAGGPGMGTVFQHTSHPTSFDIGSDGVWSNRMEIQPPQEPVVFPNAFPTNGMPQMQQNNLVQNPYYILMPMPPRMPFQQQCVHTQTRPPNFLFTVGQHVLMGDSTSNLPFPWVFGRTSCSQSSELMATPASGAFLINVPQPTEQNRAAQLPLTMQGNTDCGHQVPPFEPPNNQCRGRSGDRGCHFGRGAGSGG